MKPFSAIPGAKSLPIIGTFYKYFPFIGEYHPTRLHWTSKLLLEKYGPLVRENFFGQVNIVHIFDPKDMSHIFANDGRFPHRRSHLSIEKYRLDRPHMYSSGGLLPTNGEEWWGIRKKAQALTKLDCIRSQVPLINQIYDDFLNYTDSFIDPKTKQIDDYIKYLQMVILEASAVIAIDDRICYFGKDTNAEEAEMLRKNAQISSECIAKLERSIPFWRWIDTLTYRKLIKSQDAIYKIAFKYVEAKRNKLKLNPTDDDSSSCTPLEHFLLDDKLSNQDIMTIIGDVIIAGIETTAYSMVFVLYYIAKHPEKQEKLYNEVTTLLGNSTEVTNEHLVLARYTKSVIKESLRLNPASFAIGRQAVKDLEIRGYHIPKGTMLITEHMIASSLEENFTNAQKFIPERWLKGDVENEIFKKSAFASLPFGIGSRACLGRRFAEMTMEILLIKMIQKYKLTYTNNRKLDVFFKVINMPDGPLFLEFHRRKLGCRE